MGKRNWSLALAIKDEQRKKHHRTQTRQKHEYLLKKVENTDVEKLYGTLKFHKNKRDPNTKLITKLQEEWDFILKNKLHPQAVALILSREQKQVEEENKLWGRQSIYFNPELNPLGKPPTIDGKRLPNIKVPIRNKRLYKSDPRIANWAITPPDGVCPKFYKVVLNTEKDRAEETIINTQPKHPTSGNDSVNRSDTTNWNIQSDSDSGRDTNDSD
ncbi:uncharacterized protein KQ657_002018 [Scheffersomyces spartinae]|uniref:Uncharacterized protein n=1 Tax=Scheffersomyces spartinae TaxID=45513 RepID=A0A9P8AHM1_9ASCO|nr:uncharacterized protein KQ657_002018 [Scheffersomyces spartinae]KAG7192299.1 hypothetical protein KQ657_002018 [Scheffersomyces spartinae]